MAHTLQQQSLQRKVIYIGLILALFTGAYVFRKYGVEAHARDMSLREQDRSDVELTGTAVRVGLFGARGVGMCYLWYLAQEKQKKNQWNELELLVRSVTKLQPHFITPWLFQSWNLSYNVSVESDRERDQYFYIARGIELLYEGERQNKNHPDLRFAMAHYTMNKVAQGDKKNVLMSLFNMSCIDPRERDEARFTKRDERGRQVLDLAEFEKFCRKHPQLVRRLREKLRCDRPQEVVEFLKRNKKLPSLYQDIQPDRETTPLKADRGERFPLLPPRRDNPFDEKALDDDVNIDGVCVDYIDAFLVAHAWFSYAQEALPKPDPALPGKSRDITDRTKQRIPKMTTLIFRMFPARAMHYVADRLEQEGWFDDKGWAIDEKGASQKWFPDRDGVVVGDRRFHWGVEFWGRTHRMWEQHGEQNRVLLTEAEKDNLNNRAKAFREYAEIKEDERPRQAREEDVRPELRDSYRAHEFLRERAYYAKLTNFDHFYFVSLVEAKPETVAARKKFFEAERLRGQGLWALALEKYEEALPVWKELLETYADFQKDDLVQEQTYETQQKYLELIKKASGSDIKQELALQTCLGQAAAALAPGPQWAPLVVSAKLATQPTLLPELTLTGPFDGNAKNGEPFIKQSVRDVVRNRNPALRPAASQ